MATAKKKHQVGAEIEAWCTKCKLNRQHAIETLKSDGNINRVLCRTCEGSHLYRRPKGDDTKKPAARPRRKGMIIVPEEELANAKPYAMDGVFGVGDVIQHKHFGAGKVVEIRSGGKMEVGFEGGAKCLVCSDGSGAPTPKRRSRAAAKS